MRAFIGYLILALFLGLLTAAVSPELKMETVLAAVIVCPDNTLRNDVLAPMLGEAPSYALAENGNPISCITNARGLVEARYWLLEYGLRILFYTVVWLLIFIPFKIVARLRRGPEAKQPLKAADRAQILDRLSRSDQSGAIAYVERVTGAGQARAGEMVAAIAVTSQLSDADLEQIQQQLRAGQRIQAIKTVVDITQVNLRAAKDFVELTWTDKGEPQP